MPRPNRNTDILLIKTARKMLPRTGIGGLSLRRVAKEAGVNLGMFHYHFKNKDDFIRHVLKDFYNDFYGEFEKEYLSHKNDPEEALQVALRRLARTVRDNRSFLIAVISDVLTGNRDIVEFIRQNMFKHLEIILQIIEAGQKKKIFRHEPLTVLLPFLLGSVAGSIVVVEVLSRAGIAKKIKSMLEPLLLEAVSDEIIEKRIQMTIKGLKR